MEVRYWGVGWASHIQHPLFFLSPRRFPGSQSHYCGRVGIAKETDATVIIKETNNKPAVSVHDLSFAYHGSEDITTLDDINLTIKKGESIGIAGLSGCGKTTFIHILLKLIHGYSGEVTLFDKELKAISREELAEKIAYVPQKPFVFSGTIKDNILYGCHKKVTKEELLEAARNACILDEIQESLGGFQGPHL